MTSTPASTCAPPLAAAGDPVGPPALRRWLPTAALVAVAVVWGVTFTVVDGAADELPAPDLVVWRFGLAALVLGLVRRAAPALPPTVRRRAVVLGALLGSGFLLQAWALTFTDALVTGFLTGLLVVVAPVASRLLFGERAGAPTWLGVALAGAGVVVLGFHGGGLGPGELLTLASAVVWGLHLVLLSRWSQAEQAWGIARTQTVVVALLGGLVLLGRSLAGGGSPFPVLPARAATWGELLFLALVATAGAMVLLSWGQSRLPSGRAAVVLTLEPAVSGVTAALGGSELTARLLVGAVLLVIAMVVVELGRRDPTPLVAPTPGRLRDPGPGTSTRTGGWARLRGERGRPGCWT
jgi:drug/metabolite transporter (DMT)-like permease